MLVPALKAGEVIYTVTGTVSVGIDGRNFFGLGKKIPEGTPFTAVATFDDTKAVLNTDEGGCPESESSVIGGSLYDYFGRTYPSAGTATVTINGRSIEFGKTPTAGSQVSRYFHCWCNNMPSKISILVMDGVWKGMGPSPYAAFDITVEVPDMPKGTAWTTPGTFTKVALLAALPFPLDSVGVHPFGENRPKEGGRLGDAPSSIRVFHKLADYQRRGDNAGADHVYPWRLGTMPGNAFGMCLFGLCWL
jgi:hypothetical protein